jgi:hypothetical protein
MSCLVLLCLVLSSLVWSGLVYLPLLSLKWNLVPFISRVFVYARHPTRTSSLALSILMRPALKPRRLTVFPFCFVLALSSRFRLTYLPRLLTPSNLSSQYVCALLMCVSFDRRCLHLIYPVLLLKSGFMTRSSRNLNVLCTHHTITGYWTVTTLIICLGTLQPFENFVFTIRLSLISKTRGPVTTKLWNCIVRWWTFVTSISTLTTTLISIATKNEKESCITHVVMQLNIMSLYFEPFHV